MRCTHDLVPPGFTLSMRPFAVGVALVALGAPGVRHAPDECG